MKFEFSGRHRKERSTKLLKPYTSEHKYYTIPKSKKIFLIGIIERDLGDIMDNVLTNVFKS